jgi:S1-C subfamily serine protease
MTNQMQAAGKSDRRQTRIGLAILFLALITATAACGQLSLDTQPVASITDSQSSTANVVIDDPLLGTTGVTAVSLAPAGQATSAAAASGNAAVAASVGELQSALIDLYQQANPSVVYIIVPSVGSGSGFVFSQDGYIVTNNHVVRGGSSYEVVFSDGERRAGELVGTDPDSDLAVLHVVDMPAGVVSLPLGDSGAIQVGQLVVAIGNPFGEQGSMSLGIISGLGRSLPSQRGVQGSISTYSLPQVIQTDAPINPGNSGGPLLDLAGEVVGVNSAIASATGTNSGVGFSIPVNAVKRIVPELIRTGDYHYSYMGASFDSEVSLEELAVYGLDQTQGAYVASVTLGSPADVAGLVAADPQTGSGGDLIVAIDGRQISDFADLNAYLVFNSSPGQTVELTVLRNGTEVSLPLTLGERP